VQHGPVRSATLRGFKASRRAANFVIATMARLVRRVVRRFPNDRTTEEGAGGPTAARRTWADMRLILRSVKAFFFLLHFCFFFFF